MFAYDSDYQDVGELLRTVDGAALHTGGGGPVSVASASGRFERGEELGAGGNGTVYRAKDTVLDREVAVKVLSPETAAVGEVRERFLREARSAAGLTHPNIVAVYDFGDDDGELFLAMELVEGRNLRQIVRSDGPLPSSMLRSVTEQACAALGYAHENGVVHRDVKPANLLWTDDRALKFTDFGLAKGLDGARSPDHGGDDVLAGPAGVWDASQSRVAGTPYYMAPEQVMRRRVTQAVDIYALGVTLFELATGELPFVEGNILRSHLQDRPPTPSALRPELPRWVDRVVERCMRKKPEERYATTEGVLAEIEAAAA